MWIEVSESTDAPSRTVPAEFVQLSRRSGCNAVLGLRPPPHRASSLEVCGRESVAIGGSRVVEVHARG